MNSQEVLYDEVYDDLLSLIKSIFLNKSTSEDVASITSYLVDIYTWAFLSEAETILSQLGVELNEIEWRNLSNSVDTSAFSLSNRKRITDLVTRRVNQIRDLYESDLSDKEKEEKALSIALLLATSELHMAVEKASVNSGKAIMDITGTSVMKKWNSVLDSNTCVTCSTLHGLEIPVDESFQKYVKDKEIIEDLDYTGGDFAYAHPRCRCWLTYSA